MTKPEGKTFPAINCPFFSLLKELADLQDFLCMPTMIPLVKQLSIIPLE